MVHLTTPCTESAGDDLRPFALKVVYEGLRGLTRIDDTKDVSKSWKDLRAKSTWF